MPGRAVRVIASRAVRQWVTPRSLLLHLAFLVIAAGCLTAAWWQIHRAMAGNTLSYLYSVEWPAFVVVAGIGWWQMFHDTPEDIAARKAHHARARAASAEVVARTLPRSAFAITAASDEAGDRRRLTGPAPAEIGTSSEPGPLPAAVGSAPPAIVDPSAGVLLPDEEEPADDLTAYNRYLALLAVKGKAKTWRNPHGV
jgi:hypothetical protein